MARRRKADVPAEIAGAAANFRRVFDGVNEARDILLLGVPSGRTPLLPLAEALAGFEAGLATASDEMPEWRSADLEPEWLACRSALDRAMTAAEGLRLGASPLGYEALAPMLDEVLEPLEAFDAAAFRFRRLGASI